MGESYTYIIPFFAPIFWIKNVPKFSLDNEIFRKLDDRRSASFKVVYAPAPSWNHSAAVQLAYASNVHLAVQHVDFHETEGLLRGAVTGVVSPEDFADLRVDAAIVWHSDRRYYMGMPIDAAVGTTRALIDMDVTPILCCGEMPGTEFRQAVGSQLSILVTLLGEHLVRAVIAYEPVSSIKTNWNPDATALTAEVALDRAREIRAMVAAARGDETARRVVLLYGGSANAENLPQLLGTMTPADRVLDGGLIASAFVSDPVALIEAATPFALD